MKFFPGNMRIRKSIIIPIIVISILFIVLAPNAEAFCCPDIFFMVIKAKQYYDQWAGIRGELTKLNNRFTEEVLHANKTIDPEGKPAYVEYYRDFIGESQFRGENVFRAQLNETPFCDYLKETLQSLYGVSEIDSPEGEGLPAGYDTKVADIRVHPFELTSRCTLATIEGADSNEGAGDKDNQGLFLDAWIQSSDPLGSYRELSRTQNNFFGAWLLADREFKKQSEFEKDKDILELLANSGYTGAKDTGESDEPGCLKDTQNRCVVLGKISTPGNILAEVSVKTFTSEWDIITNKQEGTFESIISSLIEKFLSFNTSTGFEGGEEGLISIGSVPITVDQGSGWSPDFRDARNYQACATQCDVDNPPKKPEGCSDIPAQCTQCAGTRTEEEGFECIAWITSTCEGEEPDAKCDIEDDNFDKRANCLDRCATRWLFPNDDPSLLGGRCGVNFPPPQCTCEAIDPSVTYEHLSAVASAQRQTGAACKAAGNPICVNFDSRGWGQLPGGLTSSDVGAYMSLLISTINSTTNLTASFEFFGDEPILFVFDGTKTEHYDVITSRGSVWNNGGKGVCTPNRTTSSGGPSSSTGGNGRPGGLLSLPGLQGLVGLF